MQLAAVRPRGSLRKSATSFSLLRGTHRRRRHAGRREKRHHRSQAVEPRRPPPLFPFGYRVRGLFFRPAASSLRRPRDNRPQIPESPSKPGRELSVTRPGPARNCSGPTPHGDAPSQDLCDWASRGAVPRAGVNGRSLSIRCSGPGCSLVFGSLFCSFRWGSCFYSARRPCRRHLPSAYAMS